MPRIWNMHANTQIHQRKMFSISRLKKVNVVREPHMGVILQSQTHEELDALLPSVLRPQGGAFKGEL